MTYAAKHLATTRDDFIGRLLLEILAEGVIGSYEKPGFATLCEHTASGAMAESPGVVCPVHEIGRALGASECCCAGTGADGDFVLLAYDITNRERDRRIRQVDDHVDT